MVRALTKRKKNGELYARRPDVEHCLAQAIQAPATLREWALIPDPEDPRYLPSEALVHLARQALQSQDNLAAGALIDRLGRRCLQNLRRTIRPSNRFDAEEVRGEVLCKFYDLFANQAADPADNRLDYFEAQFNSAFATLRFMVLRDVDRRTTRFEIPSSSAASTDSDFDDDDVSDVGGSADESPDNDPVLQAESYDLLRRIEALPPEERRAVMLKRLGFLTESVNPQVTTVATLCGVSGRAIRDRLHCARARLKSMEEKKP